MTPETLATELAPVRIPESFARFDVQDALAALAIGLMTALIFSTLARAVTERRARPVDVARNRIASLRRCAMPERVASLAALLRENGDAIPKEVSQALYDPDATTDPGALERAVIAAARRRSRR